MIGDFPKTPASVEAVEEITQDDIKRRIKSLKPLPQVVRRILTALGSPRLNTVEVQQTILKDQALTANVLKVCNSAYYGFPQQIRSVRRAFDLLGAKTIRDIVLTTFCRDLYGGHIPGYSILKGGLMKHAVSCGLVTELIASEKKIGDRDVAFTAGLLHDIGKIILGQYASEKFSRIIHKVYGEQVTFLEAESEVIHFNHAQVGGMVAREWNLPQVLVEAIMFHHEPEAARTDPQTVSAVHLANAISSMFGATCSVDSLANRIHQFAVATLALKHSEVERIVERLPDITRQLEMI
jgi:putative nucleotidyltransferase with HDIG domain